MIFDLGRGVRQQRPRQRPQRAPRRRPRRLERRRRPELQGGLSALSEGNKNSFYPFARRAFGFHGFIGFHLPLSSKPPRSVRRQILKIEGV
ncbi:hypothetical protein LJB99_02730, partial [Deltaproteobacteria bacterium OttesenSCG-928-K17]|nr:hypothetical protein [Deltaproteobacteria bacterium OttesenSCG-928-K17]